MKKQSLLPGILAAVGMLVLILDSERALSAAAEGLDLCIRTVIPSLFPFFLLSGILVREWTGRNLSLLRPVGRLLGMPEGSEALLITGFLGGYPVGAKAVADAWRSGNLTQKDANRLLTFCSNAGPAFLFGIAAPMFTNPAAGWILWGIQILSAIMTGLFFWDIPSPARAMQPAAKTSLSEALNNALSVTAQVCGWVILFRILTNFALRWFLWLFPDWMAIAFTGFLELTNGCLSLSAVDSEQTRFLLCSAMLSWGGLCVGMQTASVAKGLELTDYLIGKTFQTIFSLLLSAAFTGLLSPIFLLVPILLLSGRKFKKRGGNPEPAIV